MQTTTSAYPLWIGRGLPSFSCKSSQFRTFSCSDTIFRKFQILNRSTQPRRFFTSSTAHLRSWPLSSLSEVSESRQTLVFHSTSTNPYHNLSLEHYILTHSHPSSRTLLFYTNEPCVVIGRNQNPWLECHLSRLLTGGGDGAIVFDEKSLQDGEYRGERGKKQDKSRVIDLIRRRSGGGTVFHDLGNLNYSVIVPHDRDFTRRKHAEMMVQALAALGSFQGQHFGHIRVNDRNDIVMSHSGVEGSWLKISGSAFKLTRHRALHHGTLLYSSPNLERISGLLRSPGKDLITAKGVESVRSKVGNLRWSEDLRERSELRERIMERVVEEFWRMYGDGMSRNGEVEVEIGDEDCTESANPKLADGIKEMKTNEWRFNQTPRFDFASGVVDGVELKFQAARGVVEKWSVKRENQITDHSEQEFNVDKSLNLHRTGDWRKVLESTKSTDSTTGSTSPMPEALIQRVESIFPVWPENGNG